MDKDFIFREYRKGDEDQIRKLFQLVMNKPFPPSVWKWKYRENPAGEPLVFVVEHEGRIVVHLCELPVRMMIDGREHVVYQGVDAMTHPDYRDGGLFRRSHHGSLAHVKTVHYGATRKKLVPMYEHTVEGISYITKVESREKPLVGKGIKGRLNSIIKRQDVKHRAGSDISPISSFGKEFDGLWKQNLEKSRVMVVRDRRYLNWRFAQKPGSEYEIFKAQIDETVKGYIVLKVQDGKAYVMDLLTSGDPIIEKDLISHALEYSKRIGATDMVFPLLDKMLESTIDGMGFLTTRSGFHLMARSYDKKISQSILADAGNWYFTYGDIDHL